MSHYETLEVSPKASAEVIRAAYKSLMQRYHPDRNPANAQAAQQASRLAQAYGVLSDTDKRAAYDLQINAQTISAPPAMQRKGAAPQAANAPRRNGAGAPARWSPWPGLLILVILLSGWMILSLAKKPTAPAQPHPAAIGQPALPTPKPADEMAKHPLDAPAATVPLLSSTLTVMLKAPEQQQPEGQPQAAGAEHVLSIPSLVATLGALDAAGFTRYLDTRKEALAPLLAEKLAAARYEELIKANGEQYLRKTILEALGEITGASKPQEPPASAYGITEVFLPESFALK